MMEHPRLSIDISQQNLIVPNDCMAPFSKKKAHCYSLQISSHPTSQKFVNSLSKIYFIRIKEWKITALTPIMLCCSRHQMQQIGRPVEWKSWRASLKDQVEVISLLTASQIFPCVIRKFCAYSKASNKQTWQRQIFIVCVRGEESDVYEVDIYGHRYFL
jgi:hypothetical protein